MLSKISKNYLPLYREAYRKNWPKHTFTFGLIDHFIERINKHSEWENKVNFYQTCGSDKEIDEDATFVVDTGNWIYFDSLTNDHEKIKKILYQLKFEDEIFIHDVREDFKDLIYEFLREKSLEIVFDVKGILVANTQVESLEPVLDNFLSR